MSNIGLIHYMILSSTIFVIGMSGVFLNKQNIIGILMSIELMLLSVNINMVSIGMYVGNINNQIFTIFVLAVSAVEITVGLAIVILFFKHKNNVQIESAITLQG